MLYLIPIIFIAFLLRSYGVNWDQGFHLHPDERMLIMVTERLRFFDQLNPQFFNYGSLPIYLLRGVSQLLDFLFSTQFSSYQGMLYIGRYLSIIFDIGTVILIYKISGFLFKNKKIQLYSSFFYAIAFFPIQNSHFFVVDVFLTFFTTLLIFLLLRYLTLPSWSERPKMVITIGMVFAAMLSTKFTAIIFLPVISLILILNYGKDLGVRIRNLSIFYLLSSIFFFLFMPYAFIEYKRFIADISAQIKMNSDPYIFPYTLQYVGTLPYLYYLKNIFLWGLGPVVSILSAGGIAKFFLNFMNQIKNRQKMEDGRWKMEVLFVCFYLFYFLVIGKSAVKFMRYMLPIYPFLIIMAGYGFHKLSSKSEIRNPKQLSKSKLPNIKNVLNFEFWSFEFVSSFVLRYSNFIIKATILFLIILWSLMFVNIYSQKHTRMAATEWILQNIPKGSTIALEHWDDGLPLSGGENYQHVELTLYDQPDDDKKWAILNEKLKTADYIIIASNRLYVPLQKLEDCKKYKSCYPKTAEYYKRLFAGKNVILGRSEATTPESLLDSRRVIIPSSDNRGTGMTEVRFKKVAEFSVFPGFRISGFEFRVSDQGADESFTVYDHPKIMIFKKILKKNE